MAAKKKARFNVTMVAEIEIDEALIAEALGPEWQSFFPGH